MNILELIPIGIAGLFVGIVSVTAGGGATVGVPFLMVYGYTANDAIVIVKFALMASFIAGTLAYKRSAKTEFAIPKIVWPLSFVGALTGSSVVLTVAPNVLRLIVLVLLVLVLIMSCTFKQFKNESPAVNFSQKKIGGAVAILLLAAYSGFFGTGYGSFLMFALMYFYGLSFLDSAAAMTRINLLVTGTSVANFLAKGVVNFHVAVPLAVGCAVGGIAGVAIARRNGSRAVRIIFLGASTLLTIKLGFDILRNP